MNKRERRALESLRRAEWEYADRLVSAGPATVAKLIERGWAEELPANAVRLRRLRITALGTEQLHTVAASDGGAPSDKPK